MLEEPPAGGGRVAPRAWKRLADLPCQQSGQALIEAALIFPILLGLFLGVSEFSEAFTVSRRLQAAAHTTADLVARMQSVTAKDVDGIKAMLDETLKPYPTASLGMIVTSVVADKDGATTTVEWSEARGAGVTSHAAGTVLTLPAGLASSEESVVFAEIKYSFQSTLATLIVGKVALDAQAYQRPRLGLKVLK
jgi:Flp pilus assembly protein TadG